MGVWCNRWSDKTLILIRERSRLLCYSDKIAVNLVFYDRIK